MLNIDQCLAGIKHANLIDVAEWTGIHYQTVARFARGDFKRHGVTYQLVEKISDYLLSDHYLTQLKKHQAAIVAATEQAEREAAAAMRGD